MTFTDKSGRPLPDFLSSMASNARGNGDGISRREFLATASIYGASAATAYGMLGVPAPARAETGARRGGTLRIQQDVHALKDPRTYDRSEQANFSRGWLEYLVRYNRNATFEPRLLESWRISPDATVYTLTLRRDVTWNNGDAFTAKDVAHNLERWCDRTVEGNSMAGRFGTLIDGETGKLAGGIVEIADDHTIVLTLPKPDITLIPGMADYPAAIVHPGYDGGDPSENPVGTGPYLPESSEPGVKAVLVRNTKHKWWGKTAWLDRIEYIDYGTDPSVLGPAFEDDEFDMVYESPGELVEAFDALGLEKSETITAATVVIRPNQKAVVDGGKPYADVRVRRALQLACDNRKILERGVAGLGIPAENHHVCPIHPEYAKLPPLEKNAEEALALIRDAGMEEFEHELISIEGDWRALSADAVAAELRDSGLRVTRKTLPASDFWDGWATYPFSTTDWNMRPLGVQVLALAYRSGEAWNESGFENAEFDETLEEALAIADADERREKMAVLEKLMQDEGVTIQPYWRSLYRHATAKVRNADMHPTFEIYPEEMWLDT